MLILVEERRIISKDFENTKVIEIDPVRAAQERQQDLYGLVANE